MNAFYRHVDVTRLIVKHSLAVPATVVSIGVWSYELVGVSITASHHLCAHPKAPNVQQPYREEHVYLLIINSRENTKKARRVCAAAGALLPSESSSVGGQDAAPYPGTGHIPVG